MKVYKTREALTQSPKYTLQGVMSLVQKTRETATIMLWER